MKKTFRKAIAVLLAVLMVAFSVPFSALAGTPDAPDMFGATDYTVTKNRNGGLMTALIQALKSFSQLLNIGVITVTSPITLKAHGILSPVVELKTMLTVVMKTTVTTISL